MVIGNYKPFHNLLIPTDLICHMAQAIPKRTCKSRYPAAYRTVWIPAPYGINFAGMTAMKRLPTYHLKKG